MNPAAPHKKRILSGMRPTGRLHLGHYVGALANWIKLQQDPQYECFFFIADWHALTTDFEHTESLQQNCLEIAMDWLSAGLDPEGSTLFVQSHVPQHAELNLLLSMVTPLGWLERVPTYKEQRENLPDKDLSNMGFLGYPVLQSADILIYRANYVPVGQDQVAHIEITREIARRFNSLYHPLGKAARYASSVGSSLPVPASVSDPLFPEPEALLTPVPKLPGLDGRKMSKSYGNAVFLSDSGSVVEQKLQTMMNDPARTRIENPGEPDICPVGDVHKVFSSADTISDVYRGCRGASIACTECKGWAASSINSFLEPIRSKRSELESRPQEVWAKIVEGGDKAARVAEETLRIVRKAMNLGRQLDVSLQAALTRWEDAELSLSPVERTPYLSANVRRVEKWEAKVKPHLKLTYDKHNTYISPVKKQRVGVISAAAGEECKDEYWFYPYDRTYEILVFLAHDEFGTIQEFVVPAKVFQPFWKRLQRRYITNSHPGVLIRAKEASGRFFLLDPENREIDISEYRQQYSLIQ